MRRPTMRDVAGAAGVSLKTVSRVVNGEPGVLGTTVDRVEAAILELGYRPNAVARSLRVRTTSATVGLVIGDLANPFYSAIARAVEICARREHSVLVAVSSDEDPATEHEVVEMLLARRVDGLLLVPSRGDHRWLSEEIRRGVRVVSLDRPCDTIETDTVVFDNAGGAMMAVQHLLDQGYRRIGLITDNPSIYTMVERHRGYTAALTDAGVELDPRLVKLGVHDAEGAAAAVAEMLTLNEPPDAIFAGNNRLTVGAIQALRTADVNLALMGFDDFELADMLGVSVVAASPQAMGRYAADLLFARLRGDDRPPQHVVLTPTLIPRGSGERVTEVSR